MAFGFRPVKTQGAGYTSGGLIEIPVADDYGTGIFNGDPVIINAGYAEEDGAAPTDTDGDVQGFAVGGRWVDSTGQPQWGQFIPAGTKTEAYVLVAGDAFTVFEIEGTNPWAEDQRGVQNAVVAGAGGSTSTGNSSYTVTNSSTPAATGAVVIVDVKRDGENENSATPILYVRLASGVHASGL